ncbi:MAG: branched-chain amino acid ABC transporter permease [Pseudorhodoferax sp.]
MQALVVWPLALACCGLLGAVVGYLALRTRGVQFIMITLAFGQLVYIVLMSLQVYGGDDGLMMQQRNVVPGIDLENPTAFYYLCLALLAAWTFVCARLVASRFGMVLQALRQSERRAVNLGAAPTPYRLSAFVLSAVGTGLAGILWANFAGLVTPDMAAWTKSGELMAIVILGGVGTLLGPDRRRGRVPGAGAVARGLDRALDAGHGPGAGAGGAGRAQRPVRPLAGGAPCRLNARGRCSKCRACARASAPSRPPTAWTWRWPRARSTR